MNQLQEKAVPEKAVPEQVVEENDGATIAPSPTLTLGDYAYATIEKQYRSVIKRDRKVLADDDPEQLHQMRVSTRRLRTALQVFQVAIVLPEFASEKRMGALAKTLGGLRDFDVQIADLQTVYRPRLQGQEQTLLDKIIRILQKSRRQAFRTVAQTLRRSRYRDMKTAYETWLAQPRFTPVATLPIQTLLPDLLSPLLSDLLLHPGWLVPAADPSPQAMTKLHDLRKACKRLRYQTEFFTPFYGESFQTWVEDVKQLQEKLGKLQDSHVLQELLASHLPKQAHLPTLETSIQETQAAVLSDWDATRQPYLEPDFRRQLHQLLLAPPETRKN